ncbi:MAG: autotransporter domain-containing protein [Alphaproteobacteria bacterium]|nr:autotransporter domain-containing protein [Alphaproteobacteria bacterium]
MGEGARKHRVQPAAARGRRLALLLTTTAAIAWGPGRAEAACTSNAPASDATVTCDGDSTVGVVAPASDRVALTVNAGATIVPTAGSAISLGGSADVTLGQGSAVGNDALSVNTPSVALGSGSQLSIEGLVRGQNGVTGQGGGLSASHVTVGADGSIVTAAAFSNSAGINGSGGNNTIDITGTVRAAGVGGDAVVLGGAGDVLTIHSGGLVEARPANTALGINAGTATGANITVEDGGAITTHGMGSAIDVGAGATVTVAGAVSVLGDLAGPNTAGAYGIIADPGADIWVTETGSVVTGNPTNTGNGGNGAVGIYVFDNAPSDTSVRVDGVVETYKATGIFAGTGNSIVIGETGRVTTRSFYHPIFVSAYTTPDSFSGSIDVYGRVESLGSGSTIFLSGNRSSSADPRVDFVANVTVHEGGVLYSQSGAAYAEDYGDSFYPNIVDNLTVAGRIERHNGGIAIALDTGSDTLTLLPTAVIVGGIDGGSTRTVPETDSFVLDGAAGTTGTFDFTANPVTNFEVGRKTGAGTWILQGTLGAGGISGAFQVEGGTLEVDGTLTTAGATVAAGATLTGSGTISGTTSVMDGGTLSGRAGSTLGMDALSLSGHAVTAVQLGPPDTTALFHVNGALTLDGILDVTDGGGFGEGTYRLFDYGGALTDNGVVISAVPAGFNPGDWMLDTATAGQVDLVVAVGEGAQYWDGANPAPGGVADGRGGSGTWNAGNTNWTNQAGTINAPWAAQIAVFSANGGAGTVTVEGTQTITGLRFLDGGDYVFEAGAAGGLLTDTADTVIDVGGDGNAAATVNVAISGTGGLHKTGGGTLTLAAANGYAGGTTVDAGTLVAAATGALGTGDATVGAGGTLAVAGSVELGGRTVTNDGIVAFSNTGTAAGTAIVNRGTLTIAGLDAASTAIGSLSGDGAVLLGTRRLVVGGLGDDDTVGGAISDTGGAGSLEKTGAGTLVLSGTSSYGGGTTVSGGRLLVDGSIDGAVQVADGAILGGKGSILGDVTAADGGTLEGVAGQTLTMDSLSLAGGSLVHVSLAAPSDAALFDVTGDLALAGVLDVTDAGGFGEGVYRLFDYGGQLSDGGMTVGSVPAGVSPGSLLVQTSVAGQVNLVFSAVPDVQFWNGTTTSPTGRVEGGPGTWIADGTRNWTDANGSRSDAWNGGFAIFQGERGSTTVAVTVDGSAGDIAVRGMQFIGTGWLLSGDPITLAGDDGSTTVRVGDGTDAGAGDRAVIAAALVGGTRLVKDDLGTLVLTGANGYTGGTVIAHGTLQIGDGSTAGSIQGPVEDHGELVFDRADRLVFDGAISGDGTLRQAGEGVTALTGDSSAFAGSATVEAGTLQVDGTLGGSISVQTGGRLAGNGTVGTTAVLDGGTAAPGASIGTLHVAGDLNFAAGSAYEVEANAAGEADLIAVTGTASIAGGTVQVLAADGDYAASTTYTILTATAGVVRAGPTDGFAGATTDLAFLTPVLSYDDNTVFLTLIRNDVDFSAIGQTPNQVAVGRAASGLDAAGPIYGGLLMLDAGGARAALDSLSGEIHASARSALVEDSRFVREAALDRARVAPAAGGPRFALWGQGFGSWGRRAGDGNAARLSRDTEGFVAGADAALAENLRVGAVAGYSRTSLDVNARGSSATSDNVHAGLYAGARFGGLGLRLGAAYSWHNVDTDRAVAFGSFADRLSGRYDARTGQVFGEIGFTVAVDSASIEPFANLAYVDLHVDGFTENGGPAALTGARQSTDATFSTIGARLSASLGSALSIRGMAGWRHVCGNGASSALLRFATGGPFAAGGVPLADDVAVVEAGLDAAIGPSATLGVSYSGQFGSGLRDHGVKASLTWRF